MNHKLLKVPMWRTRIEWQRRVQRTLRVQMRDNGNFRLGFGFWVGDLGRRDSSSWESSRELFVGESRSSSALTAV